MRRFPQFLRECSRRQQHEIDRIFEAAFPQGGFVPKQGLAASRIEPGFPQSIYDREMVRAIRYGGTWDRLLL
jgi:hypothetical protein